MREVIGEIKVKLIPESLEEGTVKNVQSVVQMLAHSITSVELRNLKRWDEGEGRECKWVLST
jgi:dUTPase